jgi:tetratricopeptide (TPR) repeat protein
VAEDHLARLTERIPNGDRPLAEPLLAPDTTAAAEKVLIELVELSRQYNHKLGWHRYASDPRSRDNPQVSHSADGGSWPVREPLPDGLPMSDIKRFEIGPRDDSMLTRRGSPWSSDGEWDRIPRFYHEAIVALKAHRVAVSEGTDAYDPRENERARQHNFARSLLAPRDGSSEHRSRSAALSHLDRRVNRYEQRLDHAIDHISSHLPDHPKKPLEGLRTRHGKDSKLLKLIVDDRPDEGSEPLSVFLLRVQAEAHLSMHAVEAWRAMCIGEKAKVIGRDEEEWLERELNRSIALSTFAYCVSRTAPWVFAKSDEERRSVIENVSMAWENVVPIRCMWIASQISLLSLHRRAYARALQDDSAAAYDDYHKLQYLIRDTERRIDEAPLHIEGARSFLGGLTAEAHHHIGELYRSQHAHKPALEHFEAASHRLEMLRQGDSTFGEVLTNSRWYIELQISRGKACYEMGRHKQALSWHLRAWKSFLGLLSSETNTDPNTKHIVAAIEWLEEVKFEPELRKSEVSERLGPVVEQLDRITTVGRVGALAAEILLRLGHLLFVLNVGYFDPAKMVQPADPRDQAKAARKRIRGTLAFPCLMKAAECDPYSTLVGADLLKTRLRFDSWWDGELAPAYKENLEPRPLKPIDKQWPRGGDDYERLARIAEYLMLKRRRARFTHSPSEDDDTATTDGLVARDLLLDLFMSTDSINVRESQIHRFLMKGKTTSQLPCPNGAPAVEFICMRRYSSPFPLLPRPSAFRALGGGYLIRIHRASEKEGESVEPYGIVVDPGVDFVENLYRTDFSLGDVDMIVITHDHVDHLGALDPLLSLLHVRSHLHKQHERAGVNQSARKVAVLTSQSVEDRYRDVTRLRESDNFEFHCFEKLKDLKTGVVALPPEVDFPAGFEIVAMSSAAGAEKADQDSGRDGHRDLSDLPSHGICFRHGEDPALSVSINSDTPAPPPPGTTRRDEWEKVWKPALEAGILVVHLGSVPLTELRRMDAKVTSAAEASKREETTLIRLEKELKKADPTLQGQIEYAQWLRSHEPGGDKGKHTAPIVGPVPDGWLPPPEHNYVIGILRWARRYKERWVKGAVEGPDSAVEVGPQGLFVIGELSEELGTMRGKVAARLNRRIFRVHEGRQKIEKDQDRGALGSPYALTADIGLRACVTKAEDGRNRVDVLCTTCNLDTDRTARERFHSSHDVYEVCVKGENEGIFYNCLEHDPARQDEAAFLEQLERFDIFGR